MVRHVFKHMLTSENIKRGGELEIRESDQERGGELEIRESDQERGGEIEIRE